jgi:gluconate kinase
MNVWNGMDYCFGVISEDGETIYSWGLMNAVDVLQWQSDEDLKTLYEDREQYDSPKCPYKIQPENQGKVVWLSGPPGAGKSTTAQLMGRDAGYVYYEADCALNFLNPFVPSDVDNPTIAAFRQKPLKGIPRDVAEDVKEAEVEFDKLMQPGANVDLDKLKTGYTTLAKDINAQKKRIGGNFSIAEAVTSRSFRDHIRLTIPDCIFITLTIAKEAQMKRIKARQGDHMSEGMLEDLSNIHKLYELPGENEPNTFNVDITDNMKPQDVMKKVLDILEKNFE